MDQPAIQPPPPHYCQFCEVQVPPNPHPHFYVLKKHHCSFCGQRFFYKWRKNKHESQVHRAPRVGGGEGQNVGGDGGGGQDRQPDIAPRPSTPPQPPSLPQLPPQQPTPDKQREKDEVEEEEEKEDKEQNDQPHEQVSQPAEIISQSLTNAGPYDIRYPSSFKLYVTGPSGCGKTTWILGLLRNLNNICQDPPQKIVFVFKRWQELYEGKF